MNYDPDSYFDDLILSSVRHRKVNKDLKKREQFDQFDELIFGSEFPKRWLGQQKKLNVAFVTRTLSNQVSKHMLKLSMMELKITTAKFVTRNLAI